MKGPSDRSPKSFGFVFLRSFIRQDVKRFKSSTAGAGTIYLVVISEIFFSQVVLVDGFCI